MSGLEQLHTIRVMILMKSFVVDIIGSMAVRL